MAGVCWREGWCVPKPVVAPTPPILFPALGGCLWAEGDPRDGFCGEPTASHSAYCERHHRRAVTPPPAVPARPEAA